MQSGNAIRDSLALWPIPNFIIEMCFEITIYSHVHVNNINTERKTNCIPGREISLQHLVSNSVTSAHHSTTT